MARPPHAFPVWELEVEEDEGDESLALAFVGAAAIVVLFVIAFVLPVVFR